jgi:hypothetical protein
LRVRSGQPSFFVAEFQTDIIDLDLQVGSNQLADIGDVDQRVHIGGVSPVDFKFQVSGVAAKSAKYWQLVLQYRYA